MKVFFGKAKKKEKSGLNGFLIFLILFLFTAGDIAGIDTLHVGGDFDYPPYEYKDKEGLPAGYNVDILRAVMQELNLIADIRLDTWRIVRKKFENGQIDIMQGMYDTEKRREFAEFTTPHLIVSYMIFAPKDSDIASPADLKNKQVAVQNGDYGHDYLFENKITPNIHTRSTPEAALKEVADGHVDCAVLPALQARMIMREANISGIRVVGKPLFQMKYCMAVPKGRIELVAQLNEGLAMIKNSGKYEDIYQKWFGIYETDTGKVSKWTKFSMAALVILLIILLGVFGFMRVLKRRVNKKTEALNRSKENLRVTLNSIGDAVIATDTEGRVERINPIAEQLTGWSHQEAKGRPLTEVFNIISSITDEPAENPVEKVLRTGEIIGLANHTALISKSGKRYQIADSAAPILSDSGTIIGVVLVFRDVTEEYALRRKLKRDEVHYRKIFETANDAIFILENDKIVKCNDKMSALFGLPRTDIIGRTPQEFSPQKQPDGMSSDEKAAQEIAAALAGEPRTFEWVHKRSNGELFFCDIKLNKFEVDDDVYIMVILRDISERKESEYLLQSGKERLDEIIKATDAATWEWNVQTGETAFNDRWCEIVGYTMEELAPVSIKTWVDLCHPDDFEKSEKMFAEYFAGKRDSYAIELRMKHKDGRWVWVYDSGKVVTWTADGEPLMVIGTHIDITERKEAEMNLIESEERHRLFFDNAPIGIVHYNKAGIINEVNDHAVEIFGSTREKLVGFDMHLLENETLKELVFQSLEKGEPRIFEDYYSSYTGDKTAFLKINMIPILNEGLVVRGIGLLEDKTPEMEARARLLASEERFRTTLDSIGDAVISTDLHGNVTRLNPVAESLTGYSGSEAAGKPVEEVFNIINSDTREKAENPVERVLKDGKIVGLANHTALIAKDGKEYQIADSAAPIIDSEKNITGVVLVFRDVTEEYAKDMMLAESRESMKTVIEATADGILAVDNDGKIKHYNRRFVWMWGFEDIIDEVENENELLAHLSDLIKDSNSFEKEIYRLNNTNEETSLTVEFLDGRTFDCFTAPLLRSDIIFGRVWSFRDITAAKAAEEMIRESEQKYIEAQAVAKVGYYHFDFSTGMWENSPELDKIFGLTPDTERSIDAWFELLHPDDRAEIQNYFSENIIRSGENFDREYRIVTLDTSETKWIHGKGTIIFDETGAVSEMFGTIQDTTDRKEAELAVLASEEKFRLIAETTVDVIYKIDLATLRYTYVSPSVERVFGYTPEDIEKVDPAETMTPESFEKQAKTIQSDLAAGKKHTDNMRLDVIHKNGSIVPVEVNATFVFDDTGRPVEVLGIARDISERIDAQSALEESEERFRRAVEGTRDALWDWNLVTDEAYMSDRFDTMLGYEPGELPRTGASWYELLHPEDKAKAVNALNDYLSGKEDTYESHFRMRTKDGNYKFIVGRGKAIRDESGKAIGITGFNTDVTSETEARQALRETERRFKTIFEQSPIGIIKFDSAGVVNEVNSAFIEMMASSKEKMIGFNMIENVPNQKAVECVKSALQGEYTYYDDEYTSVTGGRNMHLQVSFATLYDNEGNIAGGIGIYQDVTESKNAENALRTSEENLRTTLDSIGDGVISTDLEGRITRINPVAQALTGYSEKEAKGRDLTEVFNIINARTRETASNPVDKVIAGGEVVGLANHTALLAKDGTEYQIADSAAPIKGTDGVMTGVVLVFRDVTEEYAIRERIKDNEEEFQRMLSAVPDTISIHDSEMNILYSNWNGFADIPEDKRILGTKCHKTYRDCDDMCPDCQAKKVFETKEPVALERQLPDGTWVDLRVIPLFDKQGNMNSFVEWVRDITYRKKYEEELRISRKRIATLIENLPGMVYRGYLDEDWTMDFASEGVLTLTGYTVAEITDPASEIHYGKLIHKNDREKVQNAVDSALSANELFTIEYRIITKCGNLKWVWERGTSVGEENGRIILEGFITDITDTKLAEIKFRESRKRLSKFIDQTPLAVITWNPDFTVAEWNPAAERIFGYTKEEALGKQATDLLLDEKTAKEVSEVWRNLINKQGGRHSINHNTKKDGSSIVCEWFNEIIENEIGEFIGATSIAQDISDRIEAEKQIKEKNEEYKALNEELSSTLTRLQIINKELQLAKKKAEQSDMLKTTFLANLSHEIRTPMNGIMGFAELLKTAELTREKQNKYLGIIEKSGRRMLDLINDLVDISKIEAGQIEIHEDSVNLNELMEETYIFFKQETDKKSLGLSLTTDLDYRESSILIDKSRFEQVLVNLLKNAIKFTKEGRIDFGYRLDNKMLHFWVTDTGPGIAEKYHQTIFERFRQAEDSPYREEEGSGLGLAISKALIGLMGGEIGVESELGKGSTFFFEIPYKSGEFSRKADITYPDFEYLKNLDATIMIAEDDDISFSYFREIMSETGLKIIRASDGIEAIDLPDKHPEIAVIFMDIKMPGIDGLAAARIIKKNHPEIPIIIQTAYALEGDRPKAQEAGCEDYITKPLRKDELFELLSLYLK